jgi:hypothetical protein
MSKARQLIELLEHLDDIKSDEALKSITRNYGEDYINQVDDLYNEFHGVNEFKKGQFVKWKKGLKNKKFPAEEQPAIVIEILDEPIYGDFDSGTPYFREPLDLALGFIGPRNDFVIFHYDKRRFEPFDGNKKPNHSLQRTGGVHRQ